MNSIKDFFFQILYSNLEKAEKIYGEEYPDLINYLKIYKREYMWGDAGSEAIIKEYENLINEELDDFIETKIQKFFFQELFNNNIGK